MVDLLKVESRIHVIRGQRVIFDSDLAELYGVETKYLTRQVRRNIDRFPEDFMFCLSKEDLLRCQFVTSKHGGRRYLPYVFTQEGVAMLSSVLRSDNAIQVNIAIMRAFVQLKQMVGMNTALALKLELLEKKLEKHDTEIHTIFEAIRQLMMMPEKPKRRIGFK